MDPNEVQRYRSRVEVLESKCERLENDLADARYIGVHVCVHCMCNCGNFLNKFHAYNIFCRFEFHLEIF